MKPFIFGKNLINGFLQSELELFRQEIDAESVSENQELRGFAIAWISYYFNELITTETRNKIIGFVNKQYNIDVDEFCVKYWYRIPSLETAAFILSRDEYYANRMLQRLDCGQSWARWEFINCAGLIAPRLQFYNTVLRISVERNMEYSQFGYKECILLYLCTMGEIKDKNEWIIKQMVKGNHQTHHDDIWKNIKSGLTPITLFCNAFSKAKSYFLFKIMTNPVFQQESLDMFEEKYDFEALIRRENAHPLSSGHFDSKFLNETK
jgi:hypothetical protein